MVECERFMATASSRVDIWGSSWIIAATVRTFSSLVEVFGRPTYGVSSFESRPSRNCWCHRKTVLLLKHCSPCTSFNSFAVSVAETPFRTKNHITCLCSTFNSESLIFTLLNTQKTKIIVACRVRTKWTGSNRPNSKTFRASELRARLFDSGWNFAQMALLSRFRST